MRTDVSRETSRLTGMRAAPTSRAGTLRRPRIRIGNLRASPGGGRGSRASRGAPVGGAPAEGIPGHAAFPNGTVNAIQKLAAFLSHNHLVTGDAAAPLAFLAGAFADAYGQGLGIDYQDDLSGPLTHVGSVIAMANGRLTQEINIRYPITADPNRIVQQLSARCGEGGMEILRLENDPPSHLPADHPAVRMLGELCNRVLGRDDRPYVMGGGTYARRLPNAVGYGAGVKGPSPFGKDRGDGHQPDECVRVQDMVNAVKIYCLALVELDKLL